MAGTKIDLTSSTFQAAVENATKPATDGMITEYAFQEAVSSRHFNHDRKVIFVNGMANSGEDHARSALALSWLQMCTVIGVYNKSSGAGKDFLQCIGDKNQFNGLSYSARNSMQTEKAARTVLARNAAQIALFDLLRMPRNRHRHVFAHSQGNLILSNALQAIAAVDGPASMKQRMIHTFGSPAANWPQGITRFEHGFTWDPVTFLAGFDLSLSISKVGMPSGSFNPVTHGFLEYLKRDPAFVVNRFRVGGLGVTVNMDEDGLARALVAMGTNLRRVQSIFEYLNRNHNEDADDVAVRYVNQILKVPAVKTALRKCSTLVALLVRVMDEGWTDDEEKKAIASLQSL